jgi:hypothetical protein
MPTITFVVTDKAFRAMLDSLPKEQAGIKQVIINYGEPVELGAMTKTPQARESKKILTTNHATDTEYARYAKRPCPPLNEFERRMVLHFRGRITTRTELNLFSEDSGRSRTAVAAIMQKMRILGYAEKGEQKGYWSFSKKLLSDEQPTRKFEEEEEDMDE